MSEMKYDLKHISGESREITASFYELKDGFFTFYQENPARITEMLLTISADEVSWILLLDAIDAIKGANK